MRNLAMTFKQYQNEAVQTAIYDPTHAIVYPALGLAGEAGEVSNKVKKVIRDGVFDKDAIASELGDCLWYIAVLARDMNVDLEEIAQANLSKLRDRKERGTLQGNGDTR